MTTMPRSPSAASSVFTRAGSRRARACSSRWSLLVLFGWLRYDNFLGAYNVLSPALQRHVRADRARHVLRHHDRRDRPVGRLGRGHGQRGRRPAQPLGLVAGVARRHWPPGSTVGALNGAAHHAAAASCPSSPRWRPCSPPAARRCCSADNQSVSVAYETASPSSARATSSGFPDAGLDRGRRLHRRLARARASAGSGGTCWRSAAARTPRG